MHPRPPPHSALTPVGVMSLSVMWLACAASDTDPIIDVGSDCAAPVYPDDLILETAAGVALSASAFSATRADSAVLVCGDGYLLAKNVSGATTTLTDARLQGRCGGVAAGAVAGAIADVIVVTWSGEIVLARLDLQGAAPALSVVDSASRANVVLYDVVVAGDTAWIAAGGSGVLGYSLAGGALTETTQLTGARDARGLAVVDSSLLVADGYVAGDVATGGGAEIRLLATDNQVRGEITGLSGMAMRVLLGGSRAVVLRPGFGFDVVEVSATTLSLAYSALMTTGIPIHGSLEGSELLVAAGSQLQRYELGASEAVLVSVEERPDRGQLVGSWFQAVVRTGDGIDVLMDDELVPLRLGDGTAAPNATSEQYTFQIPNGEPEALMRFGNRGMEPLIVTGVSVSPPFSTEIYAELATPKDGCPGQFVVAPGDDVLAWNRYQGVAGAWHQESFQLVSNDPDGPLLAMSETNRPQAGTGDSVEDFSFLSVDGDRFVLSRQLGKVVLAKLYNPL